MKTRLWGLIVLALVIVTAVVYTVFQGNQPTQVELNGFLGGEKSGLFSNPEFQDYIKDEYGITLNYRIDGSFDMVQGDIEGQDYLFPSSQLALELYQQLNRPSVEDDIVLNTPIVLYSRRLVTDALEQEGVVTVRDGVHYVNMVKLAEMIANETSWADIGIPELYGNVLVDTTDPNASNSGNMFLGLLANSLNNNQVVNTSTVDAILPQIRDIYQAIGFMQTSSSDMFNQFLRQGVGAYPIIAGYENQLLEFSKIQPDVYEQVRDQIVILYPEPTVWSSHVLIGLTDQSEVLIDALLDPQVQDLAWREHGFRTVVSGASNESNYDIPGLASEVTQIMPMPDIETMLLLMEAVK
ncbi:hypothetical protein [Fundicoccus culcitae]|uniref:Extracellular solute-binding protein n=1 Tax=Fundicoccus culcitae TaxID=2969821 RepID=A0ABY5P3D2_9LACT|nr:hypothetical protein [Fundicoccus culcitae]UUX32953.1 hypothetical protein NRE15_08475 [Fundicoccus culcitae]